MLSKNGEGVYTFFIPKFTGNLFNNSLLGKMLPEVFFIDAFCQIKKIPFISILWRVSNMVTI